MNPESDGPENDFPESFFFCAEGLLTDADDDDFLTRRTIFFSFFQHKNSPKIILILEEANSIIDYSFRL